MLIADILYHLCSARPQPRQTGTGLLGALPNAVLLGAAILSGCSEQADGPVPIPQSHLNSSKPAPLPSAEEGNSRISVIWDSSLGMSGFVRTAAETNDAEQQIYPLFMKQLLNHFDTVDPGKLHYYKVGEDGRVALSSRSEFDRSGDTCEERVKGKRTRSCSEDSGYNMKNNKVADLIANLASRSGGGMTGQSGLVVLISDLLHDDSSEGGAGTYIGQAISSHVRNQKSVALISIRSQFYGRVWDIAGGEPFPPRNTPPRRFLMPFHVLAVGDRPMVRRFVEEVVGRARKTHGLTNHPGWIKMVTIGLPPRQEDLVAAMELHEEHEVSQRTGRLVTSSEANVTKWQLFSSSAEPGAALGSLSIRFSPSIWRAGGMVDCDRNTLVQDVLGFARWTPGAGNKRAWLTSKGRLALQVEDLKEFTYRVKLRNNKEPGLALKAGTTYGISIGLTCRISGISSIPDWVTSWSMDSSNHRQIRENLMTGKDIFMPTSGLKPIVSQMVNAAGALQPAEFLISKNIYLRLKY